MDNKKAKTKKINVVIYGDNLGVVAGGDVKINPDYV